jgi:hypothetical protein
MLDFVHVDLCIELPVGVTKRLPSREVRHMILEENSRMQERRN